MSALTRLASGRRSAPKAGLGMTLNNPTGSGKVRAATTSSTYNAPGQPTYPMWDGGRAVRDLYLGHTFVHRCIRTTADTIAGLPFKVGPDPDDPSTTTEGTMLGKLLGPASPQEPGGPNATTTARALWAWSIVQYECTGKICWEQILDPQTKDIFSLYPLVSAGVKGIATLPGSTDWWESFVYTTPFGDAPLTADRVFYAWRPSAEDWREPESPLQAAQLPIETAIACDRYMWSLLKNGMVASKIVIAPPFAEEGDRRAWEDQFFAEFSGFDNAGKTIFAEAENDYDPSGKMTDQASVQVVDLAMKSVDAQLLEMIKQAKIDITIATGVPESLIGNASQRTYSNTAAEYRNYWTLKVVNTITDLQDHVNVNLSPKLSKDVVGWFDLSQVAALQPPSIFAHPALADAINLGVISPSQASDLLNIPSTSATGEDTSTAPIGEESTQTGSGGTRSMRLHGQGSPLMDAPEGWRFRFRPTTTHTLNAGNAGWGLVRDPRHRIRMTGVRAATPELAIDVTATVSEIRRRRQVGSRVAELEAALDDGMRAYNPAEQRGPGGKWTAGNSPTAQANAANSMNMTPAQMQALAAQLGISVAQLTVEIQNGMGSTHTPVTASSLKGSKTNTAVAKSGAAAAKKASNAQTAAAKKAATAQRVAANKAAAANKSAASKSASAQKSATKAAVAASIVQAKMALAAQAPATKASTTQANAINALSAAQRSVLLAGNHIPPAGYMWQGNTLVVAAGHRSDGVRYDTSPLGLGKNWVTERGGLPDFVRAVAHALIRDQGVDESQAIQMAVGAMKDWAAGKGNRWMHNKVTPETQAKAAEALAQWEAMKGSRDFVGESSSAGDLLPVGPSPQQAKAVMATLQHRFAGSDLMSCSRCGKSIADPIHAHEGKRHRGPNHTPVQTGHVAGNLHRRRVAQKAAFKSDADQVEPQMTDVMTKLFEQQRQATLSRLTGKRGKQMLRSAPQEPPPGETPPPSTTAPDAAAIFDMTFWANKTAQVAQPVYDAAGELSKGRVTTQLGSPQGVDDSGSLGQVVSILHARANRMAQDVTGTTFNHIQDQLAQGTQAGEGVPALTKRVQGVFDTASKSRAQTIARTETIGALNESANAYAKNLPPGIVGRKEWMAHHDDRTRSTHSLADGQSVPLDQPFHVGGSLMEFPGDPAAPPDETINCRCSTAYLPATAGLSLKEAA